MSLLCLVVVGTVFSGCGMLHDPPDPNDLKAAEPDKLAKLLRQNMNAATDALGARVDSGEISDAERLRRLSENANELLKYGDYKNCSPADAWIYADLLMTSGRFEEAIPVLKKAIEYAVSVNNDDRRVNDSLRLARALAKTGHTEEALNLAQKVIDSRPKDPGPVLPSVLLELTPLTAGKGHDEQLAHLLEESIHEHLRMKVDPNTVAGAMFLGARRHHIGNAWRKIVEFLNSSGHPDQAKAAAARGFKMMEQLAGGDLKSA